MNYIHIPVLHIHIQTHKWYPRVYIYKLRQ